MSSFTISSRAGDVRRSIGLWRQGRQNEIERAMRDRLRLGSRDRETRQIGAAARPFHLSTMGKTGALPDIAGTSGWPLHIEKLTTRRLFGRQRPMYTAPETLPASAGGGNAACPKERGGASARSMATKYKLSCEARILKGFFLTGVLSLYVGFLAHGRSISLYTVLNGVVS